MGVGERAELGLSLFDEYNGTGDSESNTNIGSFISPLDSIIN